MTGCYRCNKHAVVSKVLVGDDKLEHIPQRLYLGDMLSAGGDSKLAYVTRCNILGISSVNVYSYQSPSVFMKARKDVFDICDECDAASDVTRIEAQEHRQT